MKRALASIIALTMLLTITGGCAKSSATSTTAAETTTAVTTAAAITKAIETETTAAGTTVSNSAYKDFNADGKYKVAFVCKFLTSVWFAPKSAAAAAEAKALGIEYIGIDANSNEDTFMQGVDNAINQDVDAIILTPVSSSMLPAIVDKCKAAGVAYMTTDDGGVDGQGNPVPHLGLDDYALGNASATKMVAAATERGFFTDYTKVKIIIIDVPAVESFHNRLLGGFDAVKAAYPDFPDSQVIWLDTVDGLADNVVAKFSSTYQSEAATTEKWIILGGDEGAVAGTYPILEENGIDFTNVLTSTVCGSSQAPDIMAESTAKADSVFFSGILPGPSGKALIDILNDLFVNGTPIPMFTGYPENVCDASNYKDFVAQLG